MFRLILGREWLVSGSAAILVAFASRPANAGAATGMATEWTQLLNNGELVSLVGNRKSRSRTR